MARLWAWLALVCVLCALAAPGAAQGAGQEACKTNFQANDDCRDDYYDPPPAGPPRRCIEIWYKNHTFSAATDAPIASTVGRSPRFRAALSVLTAHFANESARVRTLRGAPRPLFVEGGAHACNLPCKFSHVEAVSRSTSIYGWGMLNSTCTTQLATELDGTVLSAMRTYLRELGAGAAAAVRRAGLRWGHALTYMEFRHKGDIDECTLLHFVGFRVNGTWSVNTGITNAPLRIFKPEQHRHYLVEILHVAGGAVHATGLVLPQRPVGGVVRRGWVSGTTTLIATWGGSPAGSLFRSNMVPAENPAVIAAIASGADTRQQVRDARTASNMAILLFPIVLALVPISAFADVATPVIVAYTVFTDVLSAMPLAIKGIELVGFGNKRHEATRTWVYGGDGERDLAAAETWYASCNADGSIGLQGRLFIAAAIVIMLFGMVLEMYFRRGLVSNKKTFFGDVLRRNSSRKEQLWEASLCVECHCSSLQSTKPVTREQELGFS